MSGCADLIGQESGSEFWGIVIGVGQRVGNVGVRYLSGTDRGGTLSVNTIWGPGVVFRE